MATAAPTSLPRRAVLADAIPGARATSGARARDAVLVVAGVLLVALFAQIEIAIPGSPVPVTGQTLAVGVVGATLGLRRGTIALLLYALAGLFLPFYSGGEHGTGVLFGASGGYIFGFVLAAAFVGWCAERGADRSVALAFATFVGGQLLVFVPGLVVLAAVTGESAGWVLHNGFTIFIVGGLIKAAIGAAVLPSAWGMVRRFAR